MLLKDIPSSLHGTLIDVRTREEFDLCHVEGAVNIPWDLHLYYLDDLKQLPKPWLFYCEKGERSQWVVNSLKMIGFEEVYNVGEWIDLMHQMEDAA